MSSSLENQIQRVKAMTSRQTGCKYLPVKNKQFTAEKRSKINHATGQSWYVFEQNDLDVPEAPFTQILEEDFDFRA